jgi:hypothetical protein
MGARQQIGKTIAPKRCQTTNPGIRSPGAGRYGSATERCASTLNLASASRLERHDLFLRVLQHDHWDGRTDTEQPD